MNIIIASPRTGRHRLGIRQVLAVTALLLLCVLTATLAASAQEPESARPELFVDTIDVRVVQVEVVVVDSSGERVAGLPREDFRLLVDGAEATVDYFSEIRDDLPPAGTTQAAEPPPGRRLLVFIDDYFTDRRIRKALFDRLLDDVASLGPRDQMAVVRFDGRQLQLLSGWSGAQQQLQSAIAAAQQLKSRELDRIAEFGGLGDPRKKIALLEDQVKKAASAVAVAMRSFSEVTGRKLLVLISSGWPYDAADALSPEDVLDTPNAPNPFNIDRSLSDQELTFGDNPILASVRGTELLEPVVSTANLLGFTIYPTHLALSGFSTPESSNLNRFGVVKRSQVNRDSLRYLAEETGGRFLAYALVKKDPPLELVVDDTRSYYSLGFSPQLQGDDQNHEIRVEVRQPGLKVRHRQGYQDVSRTAQATLATEAALLLGSGGEPLDVTLGSPQRAGRGLLELPITLRIPMDWATSLPTQVKGQYLAALQLRVAAVDTSGRRSEMPIIPIRLGGPKPSPGSYATYDTHVQIRRQKQTLVLSLYDQLSGELLTRTIEFAP